MFCSKTNKSKKQKTNKSKKLLRGTKEFMKKLTKKFTKKIASFLLVFILAFSLMPAVSLAYVAPAAASNVVIISTEAQLRAMTTGVARYYRLGNNITLTMPWIPIGTNTSPFRGIFDGGEYSIYNLNININTAANDVGLFGRTHGATIRNVRIESGSINSRDAVYVGGIVGRATNTTITDSYVRINIVGRRRVGGIIGCALDSTVERSFSTGNIDSLHNASSTSNYANSGGIVGRAERTTINNTFSTGDVTGLNVRLGGIVGASFTSRITNSYATGNIRGRGSLGGIVGYRNNASVVENNAAINRRITITGTNTTIGRIARDGTFNFNRAYEGMVLSNRDGANRIALTAARIGPTTRGGLCTPYDLFTRASTYVAMGWNFDNIWVMNPLESPYPSLMAFVDPPVITITPDDLELIDIGNSGMLTAISDDPAESPLNWTWNASPAGFISFDGLNSSNSRTVEAINVPQNGYINVAVTVTSTSGAVGHVYVRVGERIVLPPVDISIAAGDTFQLGRWIGSNLLPTVWQSSAPAVATIDADGVVIGQSVGITEMSTTDGFEINVRVTGGVVPTGIEIEDPDDDFLYRGERMDLTAILLPDGSRDMHITWHSSNQSIVSINREYPLDRAATILGVGVGTARITATIAGLGIYAYIYIEVRDVPGALEITQNGNRVGDSHVMIIDSVQGLHTTEDFVAVFNPIYTTQDVTWELVNEYGGDIADIEPNGNAVTVIAYRYLNGANSGPRNRGGIVYLYARAVNDPSVIYAYVRIYIRTVVADWRTFTQEGDLFHPRFGNWTNLYAHITGVGVQNIANMNNLVMNAGGWANSSIANPRAWWEASIPTYDYEEIVVSFSQRANAASPNIFTLQYRVDATSEWRTISAEYTVRQPGQPYLELSHFIFDMSDDAGSHTHLYLRWVASGPAGQIALSFLQNVVVTGQLLPSQP